LKNVLFNASFFDMNIRYNAVINGVKRPASISISIRNMVSLLIGSPKYGTANQHAQVTAEVRMKNCLDLHVIASFIKLKNSERKYVQNLASARSRRYESHSTSNTTPVNPEEPREKLRAL
jgi:hypothetical protein